MHCISFQLVFRSVVIIDCLFYSVYDINIKTNKKERNITNSSSHPLTISLVRTHLSAFVDSTNCCSFSYGDHMHRLLNYSFKYCLRAVCVFFIRLIGFVAFLYIQHTMYYKRFIWVFFCFAFLFSVLRKIFAWFPVCLCGHEV